jgi:hypothetical protein
MGIFTIGGTCGTRGEKEKGVMAFVGEREGMGLLE